jgi:hypothetical protein
MARDINLTISSEANGTTRDPTELAEDESPGLCT